MPESWYLNIDGIPGESVAEGHKDEIDILSWSYGVTHPGSAGAGAGGGVGKASFQDFHFVAAVSKASPVLFLSCATGVHHKSATLSGLRGAGKVKMSDFLKYKLADVTITSVQQSDSEGGGPPMDQFALSYSKIEIDYTVQTASGKVTAPVHVGFDVKLNKKI
jgi:type VI secretion system secreted protein Hcp